MRPAVARAARVLVACLDALSSLKAGDSACAAHAALLWLPASPQTARAAPGLTPAPQAFGPCGPAPARPAVPDVVTFARRRCPGQRDAPGRRFTTGLKVGAQRRILGSRLTVP